MMRAIVAAGRLVTLPIRVLMQYFTERQPPLQYYDEVYADRRTGGLTVEMARYRDSYYTGSVIPGF